MEPAEGYGPPALVVGVLAEVSQAADAGGAVRARVEFTFHLFLGGG
ncbi:hypothetical protein [Amycolatopsis sp. NPDC004079]